MNLVAGPFDAYPLIAGLFDAYSLLEIGTYMPSSVAGERKKAWPVFLIQLICSSVLVATPTPCSDCCSHNNINVIKSGIPNCFLSPLCVACMAGAHDFNLILHDFRAHCIYNKVISKDQVHCCRRLWDPLPFFVKKCG